MANYPDSASCGSDLGIGAIVLVHGAWVGEYSWDEVLRHLEPSGRPVHAVSLTGHGKLTHLNGPHIDAQTHVDDLVHAVESRDLSAITLVGHSYGGRVITRAFPAIAERVDRIIYLDAHAPVGDMGPPGLGHDVGPDGMVAFTSFAPDPEMFDDAKSARDFVDRAVPQSARTLTMSALPRLPDDLDKTYVFAAAEVDRLFAPYAAAARGDSRWRLIELAGSHWLMVSHAAEVASIILDPEQWNAEPHQPSKRAR